MKSEAATKSKRPRLLGPGTLVALAAAIGILAYERPGGQTPPDSGAGRIVYEADAHGKMRKVSAATTPAEIPPPLSKPEVGLLLQNSANLRLDTSHKQHIEALEVNWQREKSGIEASLRRALSDAEGRRTGAQAYHSASASRITESLSDYSRLSHQYNERRAFYWRQALAVLTTRQKSLLEGITEKDRKGRSL